MANFIREALLQLESLIPGIYAYVFLLDFKYNIITGAKHSGKTYAVTLMILLKFLTRKNIDVLVLRKFNKDHLGSTYKQFKKLIWILDKLLRPFGFKLKEQFKFIKQPTPEITYTKTGQKILFAGMDDPGRVAGMTTEDPDRYIGIVYVEEPIEVSDLKSSTPQQQEIIAINFETIIDSVFRADKSIKDPIFQIFMTMNTWNFFNSWVNKEYPYVNFDWESEKTLNDLETKGYIKYEDPNYESGAGLVLLHTSYKTLANDKLLPDSKIAIHEKRKKFNPARYKLISLGIPERSEALPMVKYDGRIKREVPEWYVKDNELLIPTDIGVDVGQLQDATSFRIFKNKIVNGKIYRDWIIEDKKYSFDIFAEPSLKVQARKFFAMIFSMWEEYPLISEYGIRLWMHKQADFKFFEPFQEVKLELELKYNTNLSWVRIRWAPNPALADKNIGSRVSKWQESGESENLVIESDNLYRDLLAMEVDQNMKRIEDKRMMDRVNAAEQYLNTFYFQHKANWDRELRNKRTPRTNIEKQQRRMRKIIEKQKNNI